MMQGCGGMSGADRFRSKREDVQKVKSMRGECAGSGGRTVTVGEYVGLNVGTNPQMRAAWALLRTLSVQQKSEDNRNMSYLYDTFNPPQCLNPVQCG